ncbi:hypothetical protein HMPREF0765_0619 [Sphingobacterium spiritivorum ATCC 33300]|uniref:DUF5077 domain-containing protein n=1 Tax=Sphingobacterium spiritivorum ATCC 33300 TaxID=525372 RepID=C2FTG3_SPHSI|nr:DUF3472 domain-containing protein [Sphingobacterium spiritivorum]EEI93766.1 hypothetical protein HMPREF0765_0619 [Sphingobacterium spiritivorum ATCC 33300]QQS98190.1 DUF3472 domain-containing protein [Sphingobacterium spiritivorum]
MILKFFRISPLLLFIFLCETLNAQEKTFIIPANKAYAVPYTPDEKETGVSVPVGYPEDKGSISNWTNKNRSIVWYLYQTAGAYHLDFDNTTAKGKNLKFNLKMSPCYAPLQISPSQTQIVFKGGGKQTRTSAGSILINQTGYYKYELSPQSEPSNAIVIHNLIFKSTTDNAHVNQTDYQSTPSVHINFSSTAATTKSYNWLYEEVNVPQGADPLHTFYMAIGFYRGYLGMQTNSKTERRVLFSVWDSKDAEHDATTTQQDYVSLVDRSEATTVNSFGGEGTGGQSYVKSANWKTGETVAFLMNVLPQENNSVILSAWYKLASQQKWNYIASWRAPKENRYFNGFHSFLENYGYPNGQFRREADYFNAWGKENESGKWINFNKVRFSNTDGKEGQRVDYEQGVSPRNPNYFYMSSGGYTPTVKTANEIPLATQPPLTDFSAFENRVKEALNNEALHKNSVKGKTLKKK